MHNLRFRLDDRPGRLAAMGRALGVAGISLEGGGVFWTGPVAVANFLVADGFAARAALEQAGIPVDAVEDVLLLRLDQGRPGQLGEVARRMAEAGVNIRTQYSDHDHSLVLVVDQPGAAARVAAEWREARLDNRP